MKKRIDAGKIRMKIGYFVLGMIIMLLIMSVAGQVLAAQTQKQLNAIFNDIKIVIDGEMISPKDANGKAVELSMGPPIYPSVPCVRLSDIMSSGMEQQARYMSIQAAIMRNSML